MKGFSYGSSKTALDAFAVHLAHELRSTPIKVNSAHPGWVKTDMGDSATAMEVSKLGETSVMNWLIENTLHRFAGERDRLRKKTARRAFRPLLPFSSSSAPLYARCNCHAGGVS